jgi:hypothetical protein
MGNRVGADFIGDFDQAFGDQRPRDRGAEQVFAFVDGVGAEHGKHEVAHEFFAQILDVDVLHAHCLRLGAGRLDFLALADVGGEGDDFALVVVLQPFDDDRGIEAAGIGKHDFLDAGHGGVSREWGKTARILRHGSGRG